MIKVPLTSLIAPSFYELHHSIKEHKYTHYWLKGGRGSTKSSFASIEIILGMMKHPKTNAVAIRKVGLYLKDSVYEQLLWAIEQLGVAEYWDTKVSPMQLIYKPTGQKILFRGADKPKKLKSTKVKKGYIAYVWYEEVDEFESIEEINTINRSLLRGGSEFYVFYSYNPPKSVSNWVNQEAGITRPDKIMHHSTYLTVPREWLGEQFYIEAEHEKKVRPEGYKHEFLGEVTGTGGEVFGNVKLQTITDQQIKSFDRISRGIDWGYAIDPFHYTVCHYDKTRKKLYIFFEIHAVNMSNSKAAGLIKKENKLNANITADSAEPKSIGDLKESGLRVRGARKGQGSVEHGMKFLANELEEIIIDPNRCPNTAREFTSYELERDSHGNFKADYPDKNNHSIDAVRYALENDMKRTGVHF